MHIWEPEPPMPSGKRQSDRSASLADERRVLLLGPEVIDNAEDKGRVEQVVSELTGRNDIHVLNVRKVVDKNGQVRGYEVDIR